MSAHFPAEWEPHRAVWLAWPSHEELWQDNLSAAQDEFVALCEAIVDRDARGHARGESIELLVPPQRSTGDDGAKVDAAKARSEAEKRLRGLPVRYHAIPFGDIWLRDTAPLFLRDHKAVRFAFNGWGGKYVLPHDTDVSAAVARAAGIEASPMPWVLEGGSIEVDGQGTCLTTEQCLLNANRNPDMTREQLEHSLTEALGVTKVLWLKDGLANDHTDGHIDTIARFVAPGKVVCMEAAGKDDPNHDVMAQIARDLSTMTDALGQKLAVARIPSPGAVVDDDGRVMPASYLNFYIANTTVIVPTYGSPADHAAVEALEPYFPHRKVVGLSAKAILSGGGAFHCISQQEPR